MLATTVVLSLAILLKSSDLFTSATEQLGLSMAASPFIIGATIVMGGTSLPELVSSVLTVLATILYYFIAQDREITGWKGVALLLLHVLFLPDLFVAV